jgi:hypothetical protein
MDIDRRLHEAGERWRESQGPSLEHPGPASLEVDAPTPKWRKGLVPLAAAAATAGIAFGIVSLHGATTGGHEVPAGSITTPSLVVTSSQPKPSTSSQPSNTVTAPPAAACVGSQLRPSVGTSGAAAGTGIVQVLLHNISGQACHLGGVFPLQGVKASGTTTRLVFPGDSATAFPSPVAPGNVAPADFGAFWVSNDLNAGQPGYAVGAPLGNRCQVGVRYASLVIELSPREHVQMPWPIDMSKGCLAAESAAGPFPQPIPSIP